MKLLYNYLPFSMKDSESAVRSKKKAKATTNVSTKEADLKGTTSKKLLKSNNSNHKSNGTNGNQTKSPSKLKGVNTTKVRKERIKKNKNDTTPTKTSKTKSSLDHSNTTATTISPKSNRRSNSKSSPELRPRRRASQTYFFKYQLARNPLKAEEEDLKQALIASLQQCNSNTSEHDLKQTHHQNSKTQKQNQLNLHGHHNHTSKNVSQIAAVATAPPTKYDEEYLKKYRPETEDFLTFICFRITAPNYNQIKLEATAENITATNYCTTNNSTGFLKSSERSLLSSDDPQYLKRSSSPNKLLANYASNSSPNHLSPSNRRRPTRQSPRLASSNKKISEMDSSNHTSTAYDNTINYEEDVKRASIALEDMAQEINSKDDIYNEIAQNSSDCIGATTRLSTSPYKNNRHLVKGLMTREFAGAFADEEIIFESISNHKL